MYNGFWTILDYKNMNIHLINLYAISILGHFNEAAPWLQTLEYFGSNTEVCDWLCISRDVKIGFGLVLTISKQHSLDGAPIYKTTSTYQPGVNPDRINKTNT